MNFASLKKLIEHSIKMGMEEDNPLYLSEAMGAIRGVIALCETKDLLTKEERDYLTNTHNRINALSLILMAKLVVEDGEANE